MAFLDIFKKKPASPAKPYTEAGALRYELEMKAKNGKAMTAEEHEALQRLRTKDVWDQVFRIAGVITVLFVIMLAVFVFLYPYSIFNVFSTSKGGGDQFWNLWGKWAVNVGEDYQWQDMYRQVVTGQDADGNNIVAFETYGFASMGTVIAHAFMPGSTWKANFYCLGGWTIYIIATIGFVAIIIGAAFILASNIKNLIGVIRHLGTKTTQTFTALSATAQESIQEANQDLPKKKTTTRKKKVEEKPIEELPVEEVEEEEAEVSKRVEELKVELAEEEAKVEQPKIVPVTEAPKAEPKKTEEKKPTKYDGLSDNDIDRLLAGK